MGVEGVEVEEVVVMGTLNFSDTLKNIQMFVLPFYYCLEIVNFVLVKLILGLSQDLGSVEALVNL